MASKGLLTTRITRGQGDGGGLARHLTDDARVGHDQVITGHARLASDTARDHHDIALRLPVAAGDETVVTHHRARVEKIEGLALRKALDEVDEDDVRIVALGKALGKAGADMAGADDGDLVTNGDASLRPLPEREGW